MVNRPGRRRSRPGGRDRSTRRGRRAGHSILPGCARQHFEIAGVLPGGLGLGDLAVRLSGHCGWNLNPRGWERSIPVQGASRAPWLRFEMGCCGLGNGWRAAGPGLAWPRIGSRGLWVNHWFPNPDGISQDRPLASRLPSLRELPKPLGKPPSKRLRGLGQPGRKDTWKAPKQPLPARLRPLTANASTTAEAIRSPLGVSPLAALAPLGSDHPGHLEAIA